MNSIRLTSVIRYLEYLDNSEGGKQLVHPPNMVLVVTPNNYPKGVVI
jgi:hypothetical protein